MKLKFIIIALLAIANTLSMQSQGIEFLHSLEEAKKLAKEQEKIIFVDAYTTWCGPCKKLSREVFPDKKIGSFFNKNFINLKLNMETPEGKSFGRKFGIRAYPTLLFISAEEEVVFKSIGFKKADALLKLGEKALANQDFSAKYAEAYNQGNRDYDLVYNYIRALNKAGKSSLKVANDYLKSQKDLTTAGNLKLILEATTEADSKIFDYMIAHLDYLITNNGKELVEQKIIKACGATAAKAVRFESPELLQEAIDKAYQYAENLAKAKTALWIISYYKRMEDATGFVQAIRSLDNRMDQEAKFKTVEGVLNYFYKEKAALKLAEKTGKELIKSDKSNWKYNYLVAKTYAVLKNTKKAKKYGELALSYIGETEKNFAKVVERFLSTL